MHHTVQVVSKEHAKMSIVDIFVGRQSVIHTSLHAYHSIGSMDRTIQCIIAKFYRLVQYRSVAVSENEFLKIGGKTPASSMN